MKKIHEVKNSKKFNATINKVHGEMEYIENLISSWNMKWKQKFLDVYCYDLQFLSNEDVDLLEEKYYDAYDLKLAHDMSPRSGAALARHTLEDYSGEEYTCEFRKVEWTLENRGIKRFLTFINDGTIDYSQRKKNRKDNDQSYDYYSRFNVNDNSLFIKFTNNYDDINVLCEGSKRIINSDGIQIVEDADSLKLSAKVNNYELTIDVNVFGHITQKILKIFDNVYVIKDDQIVSATTIKDGEEVSLELTEAETERIFSMLNGSCLGVLDDKYLAVIVSHMKNRLINAIKSIRNDVLVDGLAKRLDILLSMINAKNLPYEKEDNRRLKK